MFIKTDGFDVSKGETAFSSKGLVIQCTTLTRENSVGGKLK